MCWPTVYRIEPLSALRVSAGFPPARFFESIGLGSPWVARLVSLMGGAGLASWELKKDLC